MVKEGKLNHLAVFMCYLLLTVLAPATLPCMADDHKEARKMHDKHGEEHAGFLGGIFHGGQHDKGNEFTGQLVAWSLAAANLTVVLSLVMKGIRKVVGKDVQNRLAGFNSTQKKYLMRFHYILNPMILLLAILHWTLSRCTSTALPEWGLATMGALVVLGIVLKFKLCPRDFLVNVYKAHTQPALLLILVSMLLIGHLSMD